MKNNTNMVSREWVLELAEKYNVQPKEIRDALWPDSPTKSLAYLDTVKSPGANILVTIADTIGCSLDELVRRITPKSHFITGDNNNVGNININTDFENVNNLIDAQHKIIDSQRAEIYRLKKELKLKEADLKMANKRIDRLIEFWQNNGNQ